MPQRRFPRPWRFEPILGGYRVIDANGVALAHVMVSRGYASLSFLHGAAETIADLGEDRTAPR